MAGLAMKQEDVIRMAREAGFNTEREMIWVDGLEISPYMQRFAALVAAAEREAIWGMLFEYAGRDDLSDSDQSLLKHLADLIRARGQQ